MNYIFDGTVRDNKLLIDKGAAFREHLSALNGKRIQVTVEKIKNSRTLQQNKYYWSVIVKLISQHTGHDPEQIHELLKQRFSPKWYYPSTPGTPFTVSGVPTSTTHLDTLEFVEYTEKCRVRAAEFLGLQIPLPGEVTV